MSEPESQALLPAGLPDLLAPAAETEAGIVESVLSAFGSYGYDRVKPPLLEFERNLLSGVGGAVERNTFRLMDPVSHRMLGLRADITPQISRIAATRLGDAPRPLRLSYGGQVLRVKSAQLRPERQFGQVGGELIGPDSEAADAEIVRMAIDAVMSLGVGDLSVDLCLPTLALSVANALSIDPATAVRLRSALDGKDAAEVGKLAGEHAALFTALLRAAGPAEDALRDLESLDLPAAARRDCDRLGALLNCLAESGAPGGFTIDPVERRGFQYQSGVCFTLFAAGVRGELGRGGRYDFTRDGGEVESATGVTLYSDSLLRSAPAPEPGRRIYLPFGVPHGLGAELRANEWSTVRALAHDDDEASAARAQRCGHIWRNGGIESLI